MEIQGEYYQMSSDRIESVAERAGVSEGDVVYYLLDLESPDPGYQNQLDSASIEDLADSVQYDMMIDERNRER